MKLYHCIQCREIVLDTRSKSAIKLSSTISTNFKIYISIYLARNALNASILPSASVRCMESAFHSCFNLFSLQQGQCSTQLFLSQAFSS